MSSKNCHVCQQSFAWTLEKQIHYFIISRKANRRRCRWHRHTLGPNAMHVMLFILYDDRNKHRVIIIAIWKICSSLITENNVPSSISWATNTAGACVCVCEWVWMALSYRWLFAQNIIIIINLNNAWWQHNGTWCACVCVNFMFFDVIIYFSVGLCVLVTHGKFVRHEHRWSKCSSEFIWSNDRLAKRFSAATVAMRWYEIRSGSIYASTYTVVSCQYNRRRFEHFSIENP